MRLANLRSHIPPLPLRAMVAAIGLKFSDGVFHALATSAKAYRQQPSATINIWLDTNPMVEMNWSLRVRGPSPSPPSEEGAVLQRHVDVAKAEQDVKLLPDIDFEFVLAESGQVGAASSAVDMLYVLG